MEIWLVARLEVLDDVRLLLLAPVYTRVMGFTQVVTSF